MKTPIFLKRYEYAIPASPLAGQGMRKKSHSARVKLPLLKVLFDFEAGCFRLEGNRHFISVANESDKPGGLNDPKGRIFIDAALQPIEPINLNDDINDGLTLPLEACIDDGQALNFCTGLLSVNKIRHSHGLGWTITCSFRSLQFASCEFKLKLPVYIPYLSQQ